MPIFTVNVLIPLGNTNQNSKHFLPCVIQILIQDPQCIESAQCLHELFIGFVFFCISNCNKLPSACFHKYEFYMP